MTDDAPDGHVEAAGGIVTDGAGHVAAIWRPGRSDWSLPKGKLDRGEDHGVAAVREVLEETGLRCELGRVVGETHYVDRRGRPKRVVYFEMRAVAGTFTPNDEASAFRWLGSDEIDVLSYESDRALVSANWPQAR